MRPGEVARGLGTRALGLGLLVLTMTPVYRILSQPETGRFGGGGVLRGDTGLDAAWWGILTVLALGAALSYLFPADGARKRVGSWGRSLTTVPGLWFALVLGGLASVFAVLAGLLLFRGLPTLVDGMVALLQGRMLAAGKASLLLPEPAAAWMIPNTVLTPLGWISQYPPFPSLLLAGGYKLHAVWLIQPLLVGVTVFFSALLFQRLLPERPEVARFGSILLVASPFLILLGGGYLSHVPAAAFAAVALYAAARARSGSWWWALLVGGSSGAVVASRPWFGLVVTVCLPAALWALDAFRGGARRTGGGGKGLAWLSSRLVAAVLGGIPFAVMLGWYNRHFFGHFLRLGYSVAFGPAHDLGFHRDPWGNLYGPMQALGFTALDLLGLGIYLLETPLPAVALVGTYLLLRPRGPRGRSLVLAWALLPVLANVLYWHHGSHLGPRMLYEAAPAWLFLTALAAVYLAGLELKGRLRNLAFWSVVISFLATVALVPMRVRSYAWPQETLERITPPIPPGDGAPLVFVHGSWSERIAARLQASGMRLDSIETALRRNDVCQLHTFALWRAQQAKRQGASPGTASSPPVTLDFQLLAESPAPLEAVYITEGERVLVNRALPFTEDCRREAEADRNGIISLAPLIWQGDLPGVERGESMFVRDLGWKDNESVRAAYPERDAYVFFVPSPDEKPRLEAYRVGMEAVWGRPPARP